MNVLENQAPSELAKFVIRHEAEYYYLNLDISNPGYRNKAEISAALKVAGIAVEDIFPNKPMPVESLLVIHANSSSELGKVEMLLASIDICLRGWSDDSINYMSVAQVANDCY